MAKANKVSGSKGKPAAAKGAETAEKADVGPIAPAETPAEEIFDGAPVKANSQTGQLIVLKASQIDAESFENQRTGNFMIGASKDDGSDQSFEELLRSIKDLGQKEPITIRKKATVSNGKPYEVISGFRRYTAICTIAQEQAEKTGGVADPDVNCVLKVLTDLEALEENVVENTSRDQLTGPDLAWAAWTLQESYKAKGITVSDRLLAARMGKNQSHISRIKGIVKNGRESGVAQMWRQSRAPLTVDHMVELTKLDPAEQMAEYDRINALLGGKGNARSATKPPVMTATSKAQRIAKLLGSLAGQELITVAIDWTSDLEYMGVKVKDLTPQDKKAVGKAAYAAFSEAYTSKALPAGDETDTEAN